MNKHKLQLQVSKNLTEVQMPIAFYRDQKNTFGEPVDKPLDDLEICTILGVYVRKITPTKHVLSDNASHIPGYSEQIRTKANHTSAQIVRDDYCYLDDVKYKVIDRHDPTMNAFHYTFTIERVDMR